MRLPLLISCVLLCLFAANSFSQDSMLVVDKILHFPDKLFGVIDNKTRRIEERILYQSEKYLRKLAKQEARLQRRLARKDSVLAKQLFDGQARKYEQIQQQLKNSSSGDYYSGHLDSMRTALVFLERNKLLAQSAGYQQQLQKVLGQYEGLQGKFSQAENIRKYLQQRQAFLRTQLENSGMMKEYRKLRKTAYYYQAQIEEYKQVFENPEMLEKKLMQVAMKIPAFREFFNKHSELASIFRLPGNDPIDPSTLTGLQTREMVLQQMEQQLGSGPNFSSQLNQSLASGQSQLNALKEKANQLGSGGNGEADMPNFKPNTQKTKSFLQRIELGSNMQNVRSDNLLPVTTDLGLSIGWRASDKSIIGVGASYKMGWGKNIQHLRITHEGFGLRSFADFKLKGSFWITGGGELNYRSSFGSFDILKNFSPWQKSALAGLSKKYSIRSKMKGNIQVLFDFLYRYQVPQTSPVLFRFGYTFK